MRSSSPGASKASLAALVASNLVPLFGVLLADWSLLQLLVLYWVESGVVGGINVAKMAMARGSPASAGGALRRVPGRAMGRVALIAFFVSHYGIFWVVHGVFVFALPLFVGLPLGTAAPGPDSRPVDIGGVDSNVVLIAAAGLLISHTISFFVNYLGHGEYLAVSPAAQMVAVYGRVVVLHATILGGALLVWRLGSPLPALVVFVTGKIVLDTAFHLREHRRAGAPVAPVAVGAAQDRAGQTAPNP